MAMTKCKECGQDVSTKAKTCPNCGVRDPALGTKEMLSGCLLLVLIGVGVVWFLASGGDESATTESSPATVPDAECKKDLACWGEKHLTRASVKCDEFVERLASYDFEWTDGWAEPKFSHYRWEDQEEGFVTYIGDKIKFSNGYGAFQNHIYYCDYDPEMESVLHVSAEPGSL